MKSLCKKLIASLGYEIHKRQPLPSGKSWIADSRVLLDQQKAPVLFDIGANIGMVSSRLSEVFPPSAQIFSFEPAGKTFQQLATHVASFRNISAHHLALGEAKGTARLHLSEDSQLNRLSAVAAHGTGAYEEVEVTTLDDFVAAKNLPGIDLIKTDTEGFDVKVLRGASKLMAEGKIKAILSEATFDTNSRWHTSFEELRTFLAPFGFAVHNLYDREHWDLRLGYFNVLFVRPDSFPKAAQS